MAKNIKLFTIIASLILSISMMSACSDSSSDNDIPGTNINFIKSVFLDQASWDEVFSVQANHPACAQGKEILSHENFLDAASEYPEFCNSPSKAENIQELAAFLGNASLETNGAAQGQYDGGLCFCSEVSCDKLTEPPCCDYCRGLTPPYNEAPKCPCGYYGRGALQLTNPFNYKEASEELYGDDRLYQNPEMVLEDNNAWRTSLNFWMKHKGGLETSATTIQGQTTCHDAIDGGDFGKTVEVINGNLECSNPSEAFKKKTEGRIQYYKKYVGIFGERAEVEVTPVTHLQCAGN